MDDYYERRRNEQRVNDRRYEDKLFERKLDDRRYADKRYWERREEDRREENRRKEESDQSMQWFFNQSSESTIKTDSDLPIQPAVKKPDEQQKVRTQSQSKEWWQEILEKVSDPKAKKGWLEVGASALGAYLNQQNKGNRKRYSSIGPLIDTKKGKSTDVASSFLKRLDQLDDEIEKLQRDILEAQQKGDVQRATKLQLELQKKLGLREAYVKQTNRAIDMQNEVMRTIVSNMR